jgi:intein/homing endonuclease
MKQNVDRQQEYLSDLFRGEFLGLGDISQLKIDNPFDRRTKDDIDNPHKFLLRLMTKPEYIGYAVKTILNIDPAPFQLVLLYNLWHKKYPMVIATRGGAKSYTLAVYSLLKALLHQGSNILIVGAAFRQAKVIFEYCERIFYNAPILQSLVGYTGSNRDRIGPKRDIDRCTCIIGESQIIALPLGDGCCKSNTQLMLRQEGFKEIQHCNDGIEVYSNGSFCQSDEFYKNGIQPTKVITTNKGYSIECTHNHKLKVLRDGVVDWVRIDSMVVGDRILLDRSTLWHNQDLNFISNDDAYAIGCIVGDGSWCVDRRIAYASKDKELVESVNKFLTKLGGKLRWCGEKDQYHYVCDSKLVNKKFIQDYEIVGERSINKEFPKTILRASRDKVAAFISGLFDTDGTVQVATAKGGTAICVSFSNTSQRLVEQLQYMLLRFGIVSTSSSRQRENVNWNRAYELLITGQNVKKFAEQINFRLTRKRLILEAGLAAKKRWATSEDEVPNVKDKMLAIATKYRTQRGAAHRISYTKLTKLKVITRDTINKFIQAYSFTNDPFIEKLRELAAEHIYYDSIASITDSEADTYDIHVPDTHEYCANGFFSHNTKIRGQRANVIIADEFAYIPQEIYQNVVEGFGAVNLSPVEQAKRAARRRVMKRKGLWSVDEAAEDKLIGGGNQYILAGTPYYAFNHFHDYWRRYKAIIESRGEKRKLQEIFGGAVPEKLDWKDFFIMRLPFELLPEDFMDEKNIARAKATMHAGLYQMEYGAIFAKDSNGFFKRSLIERCTVKVGNVYEMPEGVEIFQPRLRGSPRLPYIMSVDPASERDNFSITILELHPTHRRVVYCWTTSRTKHKEQINEQVTQESDYYKYCARKIRNLMKVFHIEAIAMDAQGGGRAIAEALHDHKNLEPGESPIWEIEEEDDPKPESDGKPGLHILHMIEFSDAQWVRDANHGLKKDMEVCELVFPSFDPVSIYEANQDDKANNRLYDTFEDCVMEIEEMKDELTTIVHTQTPQSNRDRWDTPEFKEPGGKKGRLRKDRYSALLMANMVARQMAKAPSVITATTHGGFVQNIIQDGVGNTDQMYIIADNPIGNKFAQAVRAAHDYGMVVRRRV